MTFSTAWALDDFTKPLQNSNYIGTISFRVPPTAQAGQSYVVHFLGVDGAPDDATDYTMESFPGYAWVNSTALQPASITSDEWKLNFFGSLTNSLAGDNVDADGDGAPNWQEYLAGTDPTNPALRPSIQRHGNFRQRNPGVALSWLTAPGKTYILQSIPAMEGKLGHRSTRTRATVTPINSFKLTTKEAVMRNFIASFYSHE